VLIVREPRLEIAIPTTFLGRNDQQATMKLLKVALALIVFFCGGLGPLCLIQLRGQNDL